MLLFEVMGIIAFAISGAMVATKANMDLFGIMILAVTTSIGGGFIRDLVLGNTPPMMFRDPWMCTLAWITSIIFILVSSLYRSGKINIKLDFARFKWAMLLFDAAGLGFFTIIGVDTSISRGFGGNEFLCIFTGVITGVGGGMMRDIFCGTVPGIFKSEIYAIASLVGSAVYYVLYYPFAQYRVLLCYACAALIFLIRVYSLHKNVEFRVDMLP